MDEDEVELVRDWIAEGAGEQLSPGTVCQLGPGGASGTSGDLFSTDAAFVRMTVCRWSPVSPWR